MKNRIVAALVLVLAFTACAESPTAEYTALDPAFATWTDKVTGGTVFGVDASPSSTCVAMIEMSVSASDYVDGTSGGQVQLARYSGAAVNSATCTLNAGAVPDFKWHGVVDMFVYGTNGRVRICGGVTQLQGVWSEEWPMWQDRFAIALEDNGATGDRARMIPELTPAAAGGYNCTGGDYAGALPAYAVSGGFKIMSK